MEKIEAKVKDEIKDYLGFNGLTFNVDKHAAGIADLLIHSFKIEDLDEESGLFDVRNIDTYDQVIPASLARKGVEMLDGHYSNWTEAFIALSTEEEVVSIFSRAGLFLGCKPY